MKKEKTHASQHAGLGGVRLENFEVCRRDLLNSQQGRETDPSLPFFFFFLWCHPIDIHSRMNRKTPQATCTHHEVKLNNEIVLCLILLFTTWGSGSILSQKNYFG